MVNKTIRKSSSMTGVVLSIILLIGIFTGMYLWLNQNVQDAGITMDAKYNETFSKLDSSAQTGLTKNINEIKDSIENIGQADSVYIIAWNGFKALGETLKLPISFLGSALDAMDITFISLDFIPEWAKTLIGLAITIFIVFIVLSVLKGDAKL